jgi:hypothetical protein
MIHKSFIRAYREARREIALLTPRYEYLTQILEGLERLAEIDGVSLDNETRPAVKPGAGPEMLSPGLLRCYHKIIADKERRKEMIKQAEGTQEEVQK